MQNRIIKHAFLTEPKCTENLFSTHILKISKKEKSYFSSKKKKYGFNILNMKKRICGYILKDIAYTVWK